MKKLIAALLVLCLLCTGGCAKQDNVSSSSANSANSAISTASNPFPGTPDTDMVTVDLQTEPPVLNSMFSTDSMAITIFSMSMTGLMKLDGEGQPVLGMAESYQVSEDKKTYTFTLRQDAQWSNGDPVTAQDFIFAWRTILDPATGSPTAALLYEYIANGQAVYDGTAQPDTLGVKAVDDHTLTVELVNPVPFALTLFAQSGFLPINEKAYTEIGPDLYGTDTDKLVTNGAYQITEWVHDSHILMTKKETYFDAANIKVPKVKYVMLGDENARMNAFQSGQLDMFDVFGSQIQLLSEKGEDVITAYYDNTSFCFQFNQQRKATANAKLCRALAMAIDTKSLCDNVFQDGSIPADGMTPPTISGAEGKPYAQSRGSLFGYDAPQAKKLFEEALQELDTDAASLNLTYTANNSSIGKIQGEYFQQQWEQNLGLRVELELMEWNALLQAQQNGDFDFTFNGWNGGTDDALDYISVFVSNSNNNVGGYRSPEFDQLVEQAKAESDPLARQKIMIEAETMLLESGAALPLYYTRIVYASSAKVKGVVCTGYQKYDFTAGAEIVK